MYIINQLHTAEKAAKIFDSKAIIIEQCNFGSIIGISFFVFDERCINLEADTIKETVAIFKVTARNKTLVIGEDGQIKEVKLSVA
jgi:hypothetical protein